MSQDPALKERRLKEFRLNGFVILRGFLPVDFVESLWEQVLPILRGEREKNEREDTGNRRGTNRYSFDMAAYGKLLGGPLADPRYGANAEIEELVEAVMGPRSAWGRGWTRVEAVFRGSEYMGWHSDQTPDETPAPDEPNRTVRMTFNIPLTDFTWANGSTEFIPGTHLQPHSFTNQQFLDVPNVHAVQPVLRRGDAILRDGHTLHRGAPNLTDVPRAMLDQTYRKAKAARG